MGVWRISAVARHGGNAQIRAEMEIGWDAALLEIEHQAEHWDTSDHGETGHLIAEALRSSVSIARDGGPMRTPERRK
jgi:hypothetical protein